MPLAFQGNVEETTTRVQAHANLVASGYEKCGQRMLSTVFESGPTSSFGKGEAATSQFHRSASSRGT